MSIPRVTGLEGRWCSMERKHLGDHGLGEGSNSLQSPVKKGQGPSVMGTEAWAGVFTGRAPPVLLFHKCKHGYFMSPPCLCRAGCEVGDLGCCQGWGAPCLPEEKEMTWRFLQSFGEQKRRALSHSSSLLCSKVIDEHAGSTPDDIPWLQRSTTHSGLRWP